MTTLVTNNAFATLSANIDAASSTLTVQTGEGARFPSPGAGEQAFITLVAAGSGAVEIVKYTSRSGDSFTGLTRGSDNTTAQAFTAGDAVELRVVAATYHPDGILPNQTGHSGKFLKSVSLTAQWTQIANTDVSGLGTLATQNGTFSGTSSGTNTGDQTITLTGDVTGSGTGSFAATIAANAVTFAKMVQIATARFLGRVTGGAGNVEELTTAQVKTALNYTASDVSGLALVATTGNAGDLTGTLSTAQLPALSGDVSTAAGSGVTAIGANKVTLGQMAQVASSTVLGRSTASTGNVEVLAALPAAVLPAYTGDVTKPAGSTATTIANNVVSLAKMAQVAASTFLGRVTAGSGNVEAMTVAQAKTNLNYTYPDIGSTIPTAAYANNTIPYAALSNVVNQNYFLGRSSVGVGAVEQVSAAQVRAAIGINVNNFSVAVPSAVDDAIDICTITNPNFSANVEIWLTVADGGFALSKRYFSPLMYAGTAGAWHKMLPVSTTGPYGGNDVEIDVKIDGSTATLRLRRTIFGYEGVAKITVAVGGEIATVVAASSATYTSATASANYAPTSIVQRNGNTGVGTDNPLYKLDVDGTFHTSGGVQVDGNLNVGVNITAGNFAGFHSGSTTGTNSGDQTITLTGDVTGTGTGSFAATIGANKVTLAQMAQVATARFLGRVTAATGNVEALTAAQMKTALAVAAGDVSGLAAIATTGSASNLVAGTVPAAQMPAHTGDVTSTAGAVALTIAANAVTLAKMAQLTAPAFLGRSTAGTGIVESMSAASAKSALAIAQADVSGLTTASAPTFAGLTLTGDVAHGNNDSTGNKTVVFNSQPTVGTTSGSITVDFNNGQKQKLTLTGNATALAFTFPGVGHFQLFFVTGAFTVVFPTIGASFQWLGATAAPTLNTGTYGGVLNLFYDGSMTLASYTKIGAV